MKKLLVCSIALALLFCGDDRSRARQGYQLMQTGNFDGAFEVFQREALKRPEDPELKAAMGVLLSLRSISLPAAIELLEESLRKTGDRGTRWQLLILYLDLRRAEPARDILSAERVPLEEFFSPAMSLYRSGVECIAEPTRRKLSSMEKLAESEKASLESGLAAVEKKASSGELSAFDKSDAIKKLKEGNVAARYFLTRCYLAAGRSEEKRAARKERIDQAIATFLEIDDNSQERACELIAAWPADARDEELNHDNRMADCRRSFPGSVPIQREINTGPGIAAKADAAGAGADAEEDSEEDDELGTAFGFPSNLQQMFYPYTDLPPYPDIPHWKSVTGGINLETGKEYVRIIEPDPDSSVSPGEDEEDPDTRDYDEYFRDARPY